MGVVNPSVGVVSPSLGVVSPPDLVAGNLYLKQVEMSREKIAIAGNPFIRDETVC